VGERKRATGVPSHRDLIAWQKAVAFAVNVYRTSANWPKEELFGLTGQVRRAAVSIPSNIAEGKGRLGKPEFLHHRSIAKGSLCEAETQLVIAKELAFLDEQTADALLDQSAEVSRLLQGLIRSLQTP
jgi:four helix bundle protein